MGEHATAAGPATAADHATAVAHELAEFEGGRRDPATFDHRAHVRLAYEMLARHPFERALLRYARGLRRTAARAGAPGKFHMTVTVAFLAVIAERRATAAADDETWDAFARANPDLLDPGCLRRWYAPARLASAEARRTFLLPAPAGAAADAV
jgi:hypothetical protein